MRISLHVAWIIDEVDTGAYQMLRCVPVLDLCGSLTYITLYKSLPLPTIIQHSKVNITYMTQYNIYSNNQQSFYTVHKKKSKKKYYIKSVKYYQMLI